MFMHVVDICSGEVNHASHCCCVCKLLRVFNDEYLIMSMISRYEPVISSLIVIDSLYILFHLRFLCAAGYRWLARWLFWEVGWENTRPLPACIYHNISSRFTTTESKGYISGQERELNNYASNICYLQRIL